MKLQDKHAYAAMFAGAAAILAIAVSDISKHQEIEMSRPIELSQVFRCVQPTGDQPFNERSGKLVQVKDRKTGEEFYQVQFDKTAPPPPSHEAWSQTRNILGEVRMSNVDDGVKVAADYCMKADMPKGAAFAKPIIQ